MFSSNDLDPTQLGYPLLEFAFRVHVTTYCTEVSGLVKGVGVSRVGAADINSDQLSNERINHSSPKLPLRANQGIQPKKCLRIL